MKKIIFIALGALLLQQAEAYNWVIKNNNPDETVRAIIKAKGRITGDYQQNINPGDEWRLNTGGFCVEGISVTGYNQEISLDVPSIPCRDYKAQIGHKSSVTTNQFTGISTVTRALSAIIYM